MKRKPYKKSSTQDENALYHCKLVPVRIGNHGYRGDDNSWRQAIVKNEIFHDQVEAIHDEQQGVDDENGVEKE